jgi:rhamnulose-1-phosphate aldolase
MALEAPFPELDELLTAMGEAGQRLSEIAASEGAAGNISVLIGWPLEPRRHFPLAESIALPLAVPSLAGMTFLASGSGRRLREIIQDPFANIGVLRVEEGGQTGTLYSAPGRLFTRLTSEFNSHLAVHADQVSATGTNFHAIIHAQPLHTTYLSHIPAYQETLYFNQHLLRWEPELIVHFPEGIAHLGFQIPGSAALMQATVEGLRRHKLVVWGKHGVMARSDTSVKRACDLIEYIETGARYEYLNLANQERGQGLSPAEIRAIANAFGVEQHIF